MKSLVSLAVFTLQLVPLWCGCSPMFAEDLDEAVSKTHGNSCCAAEPVTEALCLQAASSCCCDGHVPRGIPTGPSQQDLVEVPVVLRKQAVFTWLPPSQERPFEFYIRRPADWLRPSLVQLCIRIC